MNGIRFGEVHSFEDLNLILSKADLPPAAVKTVYVDNPGGDGSWDLTEATGKVNYKNREAKFTFSVLPEDDFEAKKTEVSNLLNGKRFKITLDKDPAYYWEGRCTVNQYESNKKMRKIVVGASVAPYKLKQEKTRAFVPFCGTNLFDCNDLKTISLGALTISSISTGVRATWKNGAFSYAIVKFIPLEMLIGKTITFSCNITESGGAKGTMQMGYSSADGTTRKSAVKLSQSGSASFTVEKTNPEYEYLVIWFYANNGNDPATVSSGAYVDYTNVVIELGDTVADRRNLFDLTSIVGKTVTENGGTLSCGDDFGITGSGTATGYVYIYSKSYTLPIDTYTFSMEGNAVAFGGAYTIRDKDRTTLAQDTITSDYPQKTINFANYPTYHDIVFEIKRTINNVEMSGTAYFQLEKGTTATPYTPFVPFDPYVARVPTGKNELDLENYSAYTSGVGNKNSYGTELSTTEPMNSVTITQTKYPNASYAGSYENGYFCLFLKKPLPYGKQYTFSCDIEVLSNPLATNQIQVLFNGKGGYSSTLFAEPAFEVGKKYRLSGYFTFENNGRKDIEIRNSGISLILSNAQLEEGATATAYEPFTTDRNITLSNGRKTVSPLIICTDEAKIKIDGAEFALSEGANKILDFSLSEGENTVTIGGSGSAAIVYQEGDL